MLEFLGYLVLAIWFLHTARRAAIDWSSFHGDR